MGNIFTRQLTFWLAHRATDASMFIPALLLTRAQLRMLASDLFFFFFFLLLPLLSPLQYNTFHRRERACVCVCYACVCVSREGDKFSRGKVTQCRIPSRHFFLVVFRDLYFLLSFNLFYLYISLLFHVCFKPSTRATIPEITSMRGQEKEGR